jgi:hypothetical protein
VLEVHNAAPDIEEWVDGHNAEVQEVLLPRVLSPFKYEGNLCGVRARDFFGAEVPAYGIRLAAVGEHHLLLARRL